MKKILSLILMFIFMPYMFSFFMYFILKISSKEGSRVYYEVEKLEMSMLEVVKRLITDVNINLIAGSLLTFILISLIMFLGRKYKFVVPKKNNKKEHTHE